MYNYKVTFQNNTPASIERIGHVDYKRLLDITNHGNRKSLNWLVVPGDDEQEAIVMAGKLVSTFWAKYLGTTATTELN